MKRPKITVLMPVYNAEKFLREAIDSILNQTFKDFEFLIINDASTDNSKKIIFSYKDPRIRYFENKKNLGVARTLNRGLRLAKGEYIARMDADDICFPDRLKLQYNKIITDKNLVIISSHFDWINEKGEYHSTYRLASSSEEIFYELQFRNCLGHSTVMFNKEIVLNEFNGYRNYDAEDYELWLRISKKYKIIKIRDKLHRLRISNDSRVAISKRKIRKSAIKIAQNNLQLIIEKSINTDAIRILADINPLSNSPQRIKESLAILEEINIRILEKCPSFLNKSIIRNTSKNKKNWMKFCLLLAILFNSKFEPFFKAAYKLYRLTKR